MLMPSWVKTATKEQLEKDIGGGFKLKLGWTEKVDMTIFCQVAYTLDKEIQYEVLVWYCRDIRLKFGIALAAPVYKE
jgi:hypothetical protein